MIRMVIKVDKVWRWMQVKGDIWRSIMPSVMSSTYVDAFDLNARIVPRKDGTLQESFKGQIENNSRRLHFTWNAPHAEYVDKGVPPSPGRYVPAIGRRLVNPSRRNPSMGTHPGFKGRRYVEKMANELRKVAVNNLLREVDRVWA